MKLILVDFNLRPMTWSKYWTVSDSYSEACFDITRVWRWSSITV